VVYCGVIFIKELISFSEKALGGLSNCKFFFIVRYFDL